MGCHLTHFPLKASVVDDRLSLSLSLIKSLYGVYRCDCGSVRANQCLLVFVNLSFKFSSVLDNFNADKRKSY